MMRGYTTDYVNLIADNLRDRYENGFPILKELIQNADDAKASTLIFGRHQGFPDASHPLLRGPGLWFFNDGVFKQSDAQDLRSFGINSKAGDANVIGKFGLGMKSVFHLCEALFYVAWDGEALHREGLTPWRQDGPSPHPEWDETDDADWNHLKALGESLAADGACNWFLLWLPLRMERHLQMRSGQKSGAIINRFPGDDPSGELAFLRDGTLAYDVAEMLPLLRHLERVEHRGQDNGFVLTLSGSPQLMGDPSRRRADGRVLLDDERPLLAFSARRLQSPDADGWFGDMKARKEWPPIRYRDEQGHERQGEEKATPEAAVLFCSGRGGATRSRLQWAVFLPVEDDSEDLAANHGERRHSLVLHAQFFLDAGRKKIRGREHLHRPPADLQGAPVEEGLLKTAWNQRLAQNVLLPLVLPALGDYAEQQNLSDDECGAFAKALSGSRWFETFSGDVCRDAYWMRTLRRAGEAVDQRSAGSASRRAASARSPAAQPGAEPRWRLVKGDYRDRLRPVPTPPRSDPERPWKVFPNLTACNVEPYDVDAPRLGDAPRQWQEAELTDVLSQVEGLFTQAPAMDYLAEFLDSCAGRSLYTEKLQRRLLVMLRNGLRAAGLEARRQFAAKAKRLLGFLESKRRLALSSELPEKVLAKLWEIDAPVLLVPKGLAADPLGEAAPDDQTLADWLRLLDRALDSNQGAQGPILDAVQRLLKTLSGEARGRFLRVNRTLRILGLLDPQTGVEKPVSIEVLEQLRRRRTLFSFAGGLREARMGIAPQLARAIPEAKVGLVRAETYRQLLPDDGSQEGPHLPAADDGRACLAAVGSQSTGPLGDCAARLGLLKRANDPGTDEDALRGLRFLLHGSPDHRADDTAKLWIGRHDQHPAWNKLWDAMHDGDQWTRVPEELAATLPRARWKQANIAEIDVRTLIDELRATSQDIEASEQFTVEEREEILSRIEDEDLWRRMPLHTTLDGIPVSAKGERLYLATKAGPYNDPFLLEATLIEPSRNPRVLTQQKDWLHPLDDRARIEIALGTAKPSRHWRIVMDALAAIGEGAIDDKLRAGLRCTAWLPATQDATAKPEDVIDLPESLRDQAHRLIARHRATHGPSFATPTEMDAAVRDHQGWEFLRKMGFSSADEGLDRLGLLLEDLPEYHIGAWPNTPEPDELTLLARCRRFPGWGLLQMAAAAPSNLETAWAKLGPALSKTIEAQRVAAALEWLSTNDDQWELRRRAFDTYLAQLADHGPAARDYLPHLRLATAGGQWREAAALCTGAPGVVRESLLDGRQENILGSIVRRAGLNPSRDKNDTPEDSVEAPSAAAPRILRKYFEPWNPNLVPGPVVGVVLALLGRDARELADEYLHPHSFGWLIEQLPWRHADQRPQASTRTVAETVDRALALVRVSIQVETGDDVEVLNVLGEPIRVALEQEPETLLAGALRWQGDLGVKTPMPIVVALTAAGARADVPGYEVMVPLRSFDPVRIQPEERLRDLLRSTAEQLYSELYGQETNAGLGTLWQALDRSDQLDIRIARRLILDHVPFYLRQISVKSDGIEKQLAHCDLWRRRIAEAEADNQPAESHRKALSNVLDDLADRIDRNTDEQQTVVQAVKGRLEQYQYEPSGIPFELFQNADDAAVELGQCHAHPSEGCKVPEAARRFVVEERDDGLGFLHWGRRINARGPVGFDGEGRGYDRDLEKMLILSASDKPRDKGVTGKFGLGFKSVLLACEQPRILSGRLALRVVSGILPQPWEKDAQEARQRLADLGEDPRLPGTLIDLPGVGGELRDRVLDRFRELAGTLCVFGRAVRSITWFAASESTLRWQPTELCMDVEVGDLDLRGDWGPRTRAICVRTRSGSLLMALGPQGFRALPDAVPGLWVTAPTRESSAVGFAVNGNFDLDAGRGRLAGDTDNNRELATRIGVEAGDALGALLQHSRDDWLSVRTELGLAAHLEDLDFWESVWSGLTNTWLRREGGDGTDLVRELALRALTRLSERPRAIPNGLKGPLRGFTDASRIRYELRGVLLRLDVGETLGGWTRFTTYYTGDNSVSQEIAHILREADLCDPKTLGLPALLGVLDRSRAEPPDAEVLGRLLLLTKEESDWNSDDLRKRLDKVLFQSEAGQWVEPRHLLTLRGTSLDPDERRRHALAPPECRLHPDYCIEKDNERPAVAFFLLCRQRMEAPAEKIALWVLHAESREARSTALEYLADGDLGEQVAEHVRERAWLPGALSVLPESLKPQQVDRLRRRLASQRQIMLVVEPDATSPGQEPTSPRHVLECIYDWWLQKKTSARSEYEKTMYPESFSPSQLRTTADRVAWFTMFALACFQSLGRTQDAQHRKFIERGMNKGWWQELAQSKPPADVKSWLDLLEHWSAPDSWDQNFDPPFLPWKRTFVDLYTVARHLDVYTDILRRLPRIIEEHGPVSLNEVLNPTHSPKVQPLGLDAARLDRSLGIGANWMIRELVRHRVYDARDAVTMAPYCWATTRRVRKLLKHLDPEVLIDSADKDASRFVFEFIEEQIGPEHAPFDGDFDLPLQLVTRKGNTLRQCFEEAGSEAPSLDDEDDEVGDRPTGEETDE